MRQATITTVLVCGDEDIAYFADAAMADEAAAHLNSGSPNKLFWTRDYIEPDAYGTDPALDDEGDDAPYLRLASASLAI